MSHPYLEINIGDWIAFYRGGTIQYSCVQYTRVETGGFRYADTAHGSVNVDSILELRRKP